MNFITFDRAYCLYPHATLEKCVSVICTDRDDEIIARVFDRYRARGWTILHSLIRSSHVADEPTFEDMSRWVGDGFSWTINLPYDRPEQPQFTPADMRELGFSRDPSAMANWSLIVRNPITQQAIMRFQYIDSPHLLYCYVMDHTVPARLPEVTYLLELAHNVNSGPAGLVPDKDRL